MARPLSIALQEHVVDWRRQRWPIAWGPIFGRQAPLVLEIGFGNGSFLEEQALARPERDHVGIELSWTAATHLFRRLHRHGITNVRVLLGEAVPLIRFAFQEDSLAEVFVNHPCPWPKARHHARRLLEREFLLLLAQRMRPRAPLTVVTDHAEYARWLGEELEAQSAFASRHATVEVAEIAGRTPTKYQRKAMAQGIPIHYFEWHKLARIEAAPADALPPGTLPPGTSAPDSPPREIQMPTLTLSGTVAPAELFRGFRPILFREQHQGLEVAVKFEAVYLRPDRPVWLLETLVQEDRLRQLFAIDVVAREGGLLLKPSEIGQPYPTHGVKRAVWCAAQWLRSRHPGLAIRHESLGLAPPEEPWPPASPAPVPGAD